MGFHCGNTPLCKLAKGSIKYQLIQNRLLENGAKPDITRGTLEGDITFFRLQSTAGAELRSYIAQGEILPVATRSFGVSASLLFLKWVAFTVMSLLQSSIRTMVL
jgi:L-fucose isomerase-like protein